MKIKEAFDLGFVYLCLPQIPNYMRKWSLLALNRFIHFALSAVHLSVTVALAGFKSRAALQLENVALGHQLGVLRRSVKKPKLTAPDRLLWSWLCGVWGNWRCALIIVRPETFIAWHRRASGFSLGGESVTASTVARACRTTFANGSAPGAGKIRSGVRLASTVNSETRHRRRPDQRRQV
jgi:hypothetical protein